jgi:hypothetical protein
VSRQKIGGKGLVIWVQCHNLAPIARGFRTDLGGGIDTDLAR